VYQSQIFLTVHVAYNTLFVVTALVDSVCEQFTQYMCLRQLHDFERTPAYMNLLDEFVSQVTLIYSHVSGNTDIWDVTLICLLITGRGKTLWILSIKNISPQKCKNSHYF
jgi:hypothetical protein